MSVVESSSRVLPDVVEWNLRGTSERRVDTLDGHLSSALRMLLFMLDGGKLALFVVPRYCIMMVMMFGGCCCSIPTSL